MEKQLLEILTQSVPGVDFTDESARLIDDALIDSMDIVTIVSEIMAAFPDVELNVDDLIPEHFNSAKSIWALIEAKRST